MQPQTSIYTIIAIMHICGPVLELITVVDQATQMSICETLILGFCTEIDASV